MPQQIEMNFFTDATDKSSAQSVATDLFGPASEPVMNLERLNTDQPVTLSADVPDLENDIIGDE